MDEWEKINETTLPEKKKKKIYRKLNMENITNRDYMNVKRVCKDF